MDDEDVCRICRGPEEPDEPLYHPCKCKGSIRSVHQACLMEWLDSKNNYRSLQHKCELCKTDYVFKRSFREDMPDKLPFVDYFVYAFKYACSHTWAAFCFVRAFLMIFKVSVITKYALELLLECAADGRCRLFAMQKFHVSDKPRLSHLMYVDYVLDFFVPQSDYRSAFIDGLALLIGVTVFLLIIWMMAAWVVNDSAVAHDMEHIKKGEIAHIDRGDENILDLLDNAADNDLVVPDTNAVRLHEETEHVPVNIPQEDHENDIDDLFEHADVHINHHENENGIGDGNEYEHENENENENEENAENAINEILAGHLRTPREERIQFPQRNSLYEENEEAEDVINNQDDLDDEEAGENLPFILQRVLGDVFGASHYETFAGFSAITASIVLLCGIYSVFCGAIYRISHMGNVASHIILQMSSMENTKLSEIINFLEFKPIRTATGHIGFIIFNMTAITMVLRYLTLYSMKELLKSPSGKQWVESNFLLFTIAKTLVMTLTECLLFPEFCGILLHLVFIPISGPWQWHYEKFLDHPYLTIFIHWVIGYVYMNALQVFVAACRKNLRKGVMFFLHDGDALYFMRSIMILPFPKQIRRFGASAGLYTALIVGGISPAVLALRFLQPKSWPFELEYFPKIALLRLWPFAILARILFMPLNPSKKQLISILTLWLKERVWLRIFDLSSRYLDLQSWLFAAPKDINEEVRQKLRAGDKSSGYFVRAPVEVPHRIKQGMILFVPVDDENRRLDGKEGVHPNELRKYTIVWCPPKFRLRIAVFMATVLVLTSMLTLLFTWVPLELGRKTDIYLLNNEIKNDIILYLVGLVVVLPIYAQLLRMYPLIELRESRRFSEISGSLVSGYNLWNFSLPLIPIILAEQPLWKYWKLVPNVDNLWVNLVLPAILFFCLSGLLTNQMVVGIIFVEFLLENFDQIPKSNIFIRYFVFTCSFIGAVNTWKGSAAFSKLEKDVRESFYVTEIRGLNHDDE